LWGVHEKDAEGLLQRRAESFHECLPNGNVQLIEPTLDPFASKDVNDRPCGDYVGPGV
jgi:hypothetical protein